MTLPLNKSDLISRFHWGEAFEFLYFWGHTPPEDGSTDKSCLSQWFHAPFSVGKTTYKTAEHWMMSEKARLFDDTAVLRKILECDSPSDAKILGRQVQNFDPDLWKKTAFEIVVSGNVEKFGQNTAIGDFLLSTGNAILVEAAPEDLIWGIGFGQDDARAKDPAQWRGSNHLGFALVKVRDILKTRRC